MISEAEKREILLKEYLQRKAEEEFWLKQSKKAIRRTASIREEDEDEVIRDTTGY